MNEKDMFDLYKGFRIRNISLELTNAALAVYLIKNAKYLACICGNYEESRIGIRYLKDVLNLDAAYMISTTSETTQIEGVSVISPNADTIRNKSNICLFCFSNTETAIIRMCSPAVVVDLTQALRETIKKEFYLYFIDHAVQFTDGINLFEDEISRQTYYEFIRSFLEGEIYQGPIYDERSKYFDVYEKFIGTFESEGVWINLGSCGGDTIFWSLMNNLQFKTIYAVESEETQIEILKKNICLLKDEHKKKISVLHARCGVGSGCVGLDEMNIEGSICLINMDIEGDEVPALQSGMHMIRKNKPVLAVCVYHKPDDLLRIPNTIINICSDYHFILRKYFSGTGCHYNGVHRTNELVLYAIPDHRRILNE